VADIEILLIMKKGWKAPSVLALSMVEIVMGHKVE
jgi:hypothetical protein